MPGCYYANPDCLEADEAEPRSREELMRAAHDVSPNGYLYVTEAEFRLIAREIGLGYRWCGANISTPVMRRSRH